MAKILAAVTLVQYNKWPKPVYCSKVTQPTYYNLSPFAQEISSKEMPEEKKGKK